LLNRVKASINIQKAASRECEITTNHNIQQGVIPQ